MIVPTRSMLYRVYAKSAKVFCGVVTKFISDISVSNFVADDGDY